ncbi:RTA1 like protein [Aspergillus japonicus CBS 114.51]|uniref:RTA1 like protein n=1 Tax=Aspergillus japonicus CBS 114.51 TaxID=1448312 RepID=A0A8T8WJ75_ASPJA|nr:RTA1 like protein [Aspergillus japonicus CBS 114.51]RAH75756.1 RTA1 like protein [Aspergillus japonicus CBS 114.51]
MKCTHITPSCPVEATTYGYYPNLAANCLYLSIFCICACLQVGLGIKAGAKTYTALTTIGCLGEALGYVGRIMMHSNPWSNSGYILQILLLILSPSFLAAALYFNLKAAINHFGSEHFRISARFVAPIFITCDAIGFLTQGVGGGIEASGSSGGASQSTTDIGNDVMIFGISFQAATMAVCAVLFLDYFITYRKAGRNRSNMHFSGANSLSQKFYITCNIVAFSTILIRCIYRIPEMAGGWGNPIMRSQALFMIFDGAMVTIAAILMTAAHADQAQEEQSRSMDNTC